GADESPFADVCLIFEEPIVITCNRSCSDIGGGAYIGIADVGEVVRFRALAEPRLLHLDEVANLGLLADFRAWAQPRIGPDLGIVGDARAFDMAERADADPLADGDTGAEEDVRLDQTVAAQPRIIAEPDRL